MNTYTKSCQISTQLKILIELQQSPWGLLYFHVLLCGSNSKPVHLVHTIKEITKRVIITNTYPAAQYQLNQMYRFTVDLMCEPYNNKESIGKQLCYEDGKFEQNSLNLETQDAGRGWERAYAHVQRSVTISRLLITTVRLSPRVVND